MQVVEKLFKYKVPWIQFFKYLILKEWLMKLENKIDYDR